MQISSIGSVDTFAGIKIVANPYMPVTIEKMNKPYMLKAWHTIAHWSRMHKKWKKKYGTREELNIMQAPGVIFAHPDVIQMIKEVSNVDH